MASRDEIKAAVSEVLAGSAAALAGPGIRSVHYRTDGAPEWTLADPDAGAGLAPFTGTVDATTRRDLGGGVYEFRGFLVTQSEQIGVAWSRIWAKGRGGETSRTASDAGYVAIQRELSRIAALTV